MDPNSESHPAVHVSGLSKTYASGKETVHAVKDVSFDIEAGEIVGLLGPNGAGKTTTIKSMLGIIIPDAGTVEIGGIDVHEHPRYAYDRIGAMLEGTRNIYWKLTVRENLRFFAGLKGHRPNDLKSEHEELLEKLDLTDRADTPVNNLSRGMKQKVSLASTLASDVDVVLMDEPTLGLDIETSIELRSELRRLAEDQSVTVILSSHNMDVIQEVCDSVIILQDGSVMTHEPVNSLLDVFDRKEVEVIVNGPLDPACCTELEEKAAATVKSDGQAVSISFILNDFATLESVSRILRRYDQELRDINTSSPNLEEAFLKITNGNTNKGSERTERSNGRNLEKSGEQL